MLFFELTRQTDFDNRPAIITSSEIVTWKQLQDSIHAVLGQIGPVLTSTQKTATSDENTTSEKSLSGLRAVRVGLQLPATPAGIACLAALDQLGCDVFLMDATLGSPAAETLAKECQLEWLIAPDERQRQLNSSSTTNPAKWCVTELQQADDVPDRLWPPQTRTEWQEPHVTILTSGTEGKPKAAMHTWSTLARPVRRLSALQKQQSPQTWLLSFRVHLYAGLQVMLQALLNHGTVVLPAIGDSPDAVVALMASGAVTHASATPSFWRRLVLFANRAQFASVPLRQITLGGEAADQPILNALRDIFPQARLAHIYATTELGRCFSVTDGLAGFPRSYIDQPTSDSVEIKIQDNQLYVRSANAMKGYDGAASDSQIHSADGGWRGTGDLVHVVGDRVLFVGREGDLINVGGNKVRPLLVEKVVRSVDGVADCRVFAKSSSIAGQLVACEIVLTENANEAQVKQAISRACQENLQSFECPPIFANDDSASTLGGGKNPTEVGSQVIDDQSWSMGKPAAIFRLGYESLAEHARPR